MATNVPVAPAACQRAAGSAFAEEKSGCELVASARGDHAEAEDACEPCNEEKDPDPAAQVAADAGAEGQAAERQGDEPHDLPEHRPRLISTERRRLGGTQAWVGGDLGWLPS
jgi:hypothetical protein